MKSKVVAVHDELKELKAAVAALASGVAVAKLVADLGVAAPGGSAPCSKIDEVAALRRDFLTLTTLVGQQKDTLCATMC